MVSLAHTLQKAEEGFAAVERLLKEAGRCAAKKSWWKNERKDEEGQKTAAQWGKEEERLKEKAKALRLELKELTGSVYNLKRKRAGLKRKAAENKGQSSLLVSREVWPRSHYGSSVQS